MFDITLITMGKLKEKFYISAAEEYKKRLGGYCRFTLLELPELRLPENPSPAEITAGLEKEAELIFSKIPKGAWFCVFTPEGKLLSSEGFAEKLASVKNSGKSSACFLIGSSFGMADRVKQKADFKLSMSPMTFPHHLARVMVLEQLCRARMMASVCPRIRSPALDICIPPSEEFSVLILCAFIISRSTSPVKVPHNKKTRKEGIFPCRIIYL